MIKPRIKKVNGEWRVMHYEWVFMNGYILYVQAYNFCIMLNNRK